MKNLRSILIPALSILAPLALSESAFAYHPKGSEEVDKIVFGSCSQQAFDQSYWPKIKKEDPDLWIWLGDIMYGNSTIPEELQARYQQLKNNAYYKSFAQTQPIIGIWDDHDYGANDAGIEFESKVPSQKLLLDFLDEPTDSPRRAQKGAYTSYKFKSPLVKGARGSVKIIVLDMRYFKPQPGEHADLLGPAQWNWLERELQDPADLVAIVSSISFKRVVPWGESWHQYPASKKRFFKLVNQYIPGSGIVLLTGDQHHGAIRKVPRKFSNDRRIYELMSSGLTHAGIQRHKPRREDKTKTLNKDVLAKMYLKRNYGKIEIDWEARKAVLSVMNLKRGTTGQTKTIDF